MCLVKEKSHTSLEKETRCLWNHLNCLYLKKKKVTLSIAARSESPICQDNISGVDKDFQTWSVCCLATWRREGPTWAPPLNPSGDQASLSSRDGLSRNEGSLRPWTHCPSPCRFLPRYLRPIKCKQMRKGKLKEAKGKGAAYRERSQGLTESKRKTPIVRMTWSWAFSTCSLVVWSKNIFVVSKGYFLLLTLKKNSLHN